MSKGTKDSVEATVGLDVGDKHTHFCVLSSDGKIVKEGKFPTTPGVFRRQFVDCPRFRVALEAGRHSAWISDIIKEGAHEIFVANPRKLRGIYENPTKSDRVDARYLARVARLDPQLLSPIYQRTPETRADKELLLARNVLVELRTKLINHIRGVVKGFAGSVPPIGAESFHVKACPHIPRELWAILSPLIDTVADANRRIRDYDKRIESISEARYPETALLRSVPGVGPITALAYVLTIEDPSRFPKSRTVGSYLGLAPRRDQSGECDKQLHITKAGDRMVRRLLVQCAQHILGRFAPDTDLRRWGLAYYGRGGRSAKKRAVVAVARRLAVLLHRLWTTGETYDPLRNTNRLHPVLAS